MNSSYNVAQPQMRRLREELHRADKIMNQIKDGNAQWTDLLKENDFFSDHVHYLQVSLSLLSLGDDVKVQCYQGAPLLTIYFISCCQGEDYC
jgi:poly(A) polymerase Pap1